MAKVQYVKAQDDPKGSRAQQVASMIQQLVDASNEPIPFETLCEEAGAKYPQDVQSAMVALELVGAVVRYTYADPGSTRARVAYAFGKAVKVS